MIDTDDLNVGGNSWKSYYKLAGVTAWIQLALTLVIIIVASAIGARPETAEGYFNLFQEGGRFAGILQVDFTSLVLISLYSITFIALYHALRPVSSAYSALAAVLTFIVVAATISTESTFSMLHLSDLYKEASEVGRRSVLIAAGEALIAGDMWHGSAGVMAGIMLQGAGVVISVIMMKSKDFKLISALAGLIANGLDLIQHLIHHLSGSEIAGFILYMAGPLYLIWYFFLGLDLFNLGKKEIV